VDTLKIDRSFVSEVPTDPTLNALIKAITTVAHSLNMKVVAEGVESTEQIEILGELDCDQVQGYYFSPAIPAGDIEKLLLRSTVAPC
jgi:EAL domain-containing protein (putative c-di-GMP-specific phosphodiesterase class I)